MAVRKRKMPAKLSAAMELKKAKRAPKSYRPAPLRAPAGAQGLPNNPKLGQRAEVGGGRVGGHIYEWTGRRWRLVASKR
jgi:hypothetical protein